VTEAGASEGGTIAQGSADARGPAIPEGGAAGEFEASTVEAGSIEDATSGVPSDGSAPPGDSGIGRPPQETQYTPPFDPSSVPGIQPLFDGLTLGGWNCNTAPNGWSVIDGAIVGKSAVAGEFCATRANYSEFRLFASIIQVSGNGGHSGLGFGGQNPPPGSWSNEAFKFLDLMTPSCYFWDYARNAGALGKIVACVDMTKAPYDVPWQGQWFQVEMTVSLSAGKVRAALDGVDFLTYDIGTPDPFKNGPIGLQAHAGNQEVRYKDLWIQVNPANPDVLLSVK
jgi:hypothetical protein